MSLKTQKNNKDVSEFIAAQDNEQRRIDCEKMRELMEKITKKPAIMWGDSMVGFGQYHYTYKTGHSGSWFMTGFSPRKQNFTVYIMQGFSQYQDLLDKLGKYKLGKSCLYVKNLDDIDLSVLDKIIRGSIKYLEKNYNCE